MTILKRPPLLLGALLCLTLGQLLFIIKQPPTIDSLIWPGLGLYLLGGVLALRFFRSTPDDDPATGASWQPSRRTQLWCAVGVTALAATLRLIWLDRLPFKVDGDAAAFAKAAADFLKPNHPPLIGTGWQSHTNVYFFLTSLMLRLFGRTVLGMRGLSALGGILGVLAVFALGRSLWGFRVGLLAALTLAVQPFDLVFSRVGTEVIHLTWLLPLVILCIWEGWKQERWLLLLAGGMATGLSQYFYPGARLIPLLAIGQIALLALWPPAGRRDLLRGLRTLGVLAVGALLVYGPMIPYFIQHPDIYTARLKLVSITSSGWLDKQLAQQPWWRVLVDQLRRAYLPFHYPVKGPALWYQWPQYLSPLDAALLSLGLLAVWSGWRTPRWLRLYFAGYLLGGIVLAGVLTIDTPMPSRYMAFMPGVALLIGVALEQTLLQGLALLAPEQARARRSVALALLGAALCVYSGSGLRSYLEHDTVVVEQRDQTNLLGTYAARYLQSLPDQSFDILYLKSNLLYFEASPALAFLTAKTGKNIEEPLDCSVLQQHISPQSQVVIAPPDRIEELRRMESQVYGARLEVRTNAKGEPMAGILELPPPPTGGLYPCITPAAGG
jgi:4-amino-4-deoxy-L-arabinose transferase-like glycosyltransferase